MTRDQPQVAAWGISLFSLQNRSSDSGRFPKKQGTGSAVETAAPEEIVKDAFGGILLMIPPRCLEKPPQKTLRLYHSSHSAGGGHKTKTGNQGTKNTQTQDSG